VNDSWSSRHIVSAVAELSAGVFGAFTEPGVADTPERAAKPNRATVAAWSRERRIVVRSGLCEWGQ
jgi:hypothetical protein